jgi:hypothetical protein
MSPWETKEDGDMIFFPNRTIARRDDVVERVKEEVRKPAGVAGPPERADEGRGRVQVSVAGEGTLPPCTQPADETLVPDPRSGLTPAELVERKLVAMLRGAPLPVSLICGNRLTGRERVYSRPEYVP